MSLKIARRDAFKTFLDNTKYDILGIEKHLHNLIFLQMVEMGIEDKVNLQEEVCRSCIDLTEIEEFFCD